MITLVEPLNIGYLVERPDLGCATLLAVCREAGHATRLVTGQSAYLDAVLSTFAGEAWDLLSVLSDDQLGAVGFSPAVRRRGPDAFAASLLELLARVKARRTARDHLDLRAVHELRAVLLAIMKLHADACLRHEGRRLRFVGWYASRILDGDPSAVGFAVNVALDPLTRAVAEAVRAAGVPVFAGGAWTHGWDAAKAAAMVSQGPFAAIVVGPAEEAILPLADALGSGATVSGIPNVFAIRDGKQCANELRPLADLERQPVPDFSDYDLDAFLPSERILPVRTSTGCAWGRCAFCAYPVNSFRSCVAQSAGAAVEAMATLSERYACRHFTLHDDELSPARAADLSDALRSRRLDVRLDAYARLEKRFLDGDLLPRMAEAGFRTLYWGLESGSDRVLRSMRKGTTTRRAAAILEAAAHAGLSNHCFVLVGFPGETLAEAEETLAFLQEHAEAIDAIGLQAFVLSRDAPVGKDPARWGLEPHADGSYDVASGLSQAEAARLVTRIERQHQLGEPVYTSRRARLLQSPSGFGAGRAVFLAHGLLDAEAAARLVRAEPSDLFPLIGGRVEGRSWSPLDFTQTLTLQRLRPPAARELRAAEARLVAAADGTQDAALVMHMAGAAEDGGHESALAAFLSSCLLDGLALGFREAFPA